jgi:predicted membrane-bound spermidine synthase
MRTDSSELTPEQAMELRQFAESLNDQLYISSSSGSEKAFGLGCGLGLLPVLGVILVLWLVGALSLIPALFLSVVGLVTLVGISLLLAQVARLRAIRRIYSAEVEPEIVTFINEQQIDRQIFDAIASQSLPGDAPLQEFLTPVQLDTDKIVSDAS